MNQQSSARPTRAPGSFQRRWAALATFSWHTLVILLLTAVIVVGLNRLKVVVIPIFLAVFLASLGSPLVVWLRRKGFRPLPATWIVILLGLLTVGMFLWFIVAEVIEAIDDLDTTVAEGWEQFQVWLATGPLGLGAERVEEVIGEFLEQLRGSTGQLFDQLLAGAGTVTELVTGLVLTFIVAFFMIKDGDRFWQWTVTRFPLEKQPIVEEAGASAWTTLRRYLAGTAIVGLVDAVLIGGALAIVGNPLLLPLSLLVFAGGFFPFVGAIISGTIATLATLATVGFGQAVAIAVVTIVVQQIEGDLLQPLVMGHAVRLHPLIVILSLAIGAIVGGLVGAFLAVPSVAVVTQVIRTVRPAWLQTDPALDDPG